MKKAAGGLAAFKFHEGVLGLKQWEIPGGGLSGAHLL